VLAEGGAGDGFISRIPDAGRGATNRPPVVRMRGLPVRVMCTSEMARRCRCRALFAILGAVDRTAVGREAIVAGGGCGIPGWAATAVD